MTVKLKLKRGEVQFRIKNSSYQEMVHCTGQIPHHTLVVVCAEGLVPRIGEDGMLFVVVES